MPINVHKNKRRMADSDSFESADEETAPELTQVPPSEEPQPEEDSLQTPPVAPQTPSPVPETTSPPTESIPESTVSGIQPSDKCDDEIRPDPVITTKATDGWDWGGWSSWAATSVSSVAEIASKTKKELSGALETFEASLGLPTPEELAREMKKEEEVTTEMVINENEQKPEGSSETDPKSGGYGTGFWSGLSSLSATSSQYIASGLETLEKVSNQAFDALNDPLTDLDQPKQKPRKRDSTKGASLMSVLQEAKAKYEQQEKVSAETKRTMSYLFDEKQGLSQLEALEMLSKECVYKMKNHPNDGNTLFLYIETSLELKGGDSELIIEQLGAAIADCLKTLKIDLPITKINQCRYEVAQQLSDMDMSTLDETAKPSDIKKGAVLDTALNNIAAFSARSVELFKKIAELSLLKSSLDVDMKTQADTVKFLNEVLCCEIENIREQFERKMDSESDVEVLFLETSNAVSYLQETLYFFIPILKWVVVKTSRS